jgi:hypothetical protein
VLEEDNLGHFCETKPKSLLLSVAGLGFKFAIRPREGHLWTVNTRPPPSPIKSNWKALYRAAIFETNRNAIPWRLTAAEQAILARGQELFRRTGNLEKREEH